jgi:hypothetical protein
MISRKQEERMQDAYDDGFSVGLNMGYIAAETRIKNHIAQIGNMDWLLDELDQMDGPEETEDCE